jgi:prepilin-type N-terminal cleavage/methylation domain-containing protein/prepilin-type processing-associated H-X9-DG protein
MPSNHTAYTTRRPHRHAFTLVELLVVIGIIAVLIGILLPTLAKAREQGNTVKCASNLRTIGQGIAAYLIDNKNTYPAAYIYAGMAINNGVQTPGAADNGYLHWSSFLYGDKSKQGQKTAYLSTSGWDAFTCPSIPDGGLPPTNTYAANRDAGQSNDDGDSTIDFQAPRLAYTVNEAIMPRNKFVINFQGAKRTYQFVRGGTIKKSAETILATEWNRDWRIVADAGRGDPNATVCKSHRPLHGFTGVSGELNMDQVAPDFRGRATYRAVTTVDMQKNPTPAAASSSRLDWVGRNHGSSKKTGNGTDARTSNFLYVDGHVETKNVVETVTPKFQWGERMYTLVPNNDMLNP